MTPRKPFKARAWVFQKEPEGSNYIEWNYAYVKMLAHPGTKIIPVDVIERRRKKI